MWEERSARGRRAGGRRRTVGDQIGRIVGAPAGSTVMHQNVAVAEAVALSCFRPIDHARNRVVYERGSFPPSATSIRRNRSRRRHLRVGRGDRRADRRANVARADQPCPLQGRPDPGRGGDGAAGARDGRARDPRLLPVGGSSRSTSLRSTSTSRSAGPSSGSAEALGTAGCTCAGSRRAARADLHRLAGARAPVRVRGGDGVRDRRGAVPDGHPNAAAHYAGTAGYDLVEEIGVDRIRESSSGRRSSSSIWRTPPASRSRALVSRIAAEGRSCSAFVSSRPSKPSSRRGRFSATSPGRRHPPGPALLHHRRRAPVRGGADHRDPRHARVRAPPRRRRAPLIGWRKIPEGVGVCGRGAPVSHQPPRLLRGIGRQSWMPCPRDRAAARSGRSGVFRQRLSLQTSKRVR